MTKFLVSGTSSRNNDVPVVYNCCTTFPIPSFYIMKYICGHQKEIQNYNYFNAVAIHSA